MRSSRSLVLAAIGGLAVLMTLLAPAGASAAPGGNDKSAEARARHEQAVKYWSPQRIAHAKPMDLLRVNRGTGKVERQAKPCNPRKEDCSGGDGDTGGGGGDTGGGGDPEPSPLPAATTSTPWASSGYDSVDDDVRTVTGKVLLTLGPSDGDHDYVCSASAVQDESDGDGEALILTAGHCVYDDVNAIWATNWTFFPDYGNSGTGKTVRDCETNTLGCWTAQRIVTSGSWVDRGDFSYDFAFVSVGSGGRTGSLQGLEAAIDASGDGAAPAVVGFNRTRGEFLTSFGYPQAPPYDGQSLQYCAGDAKAWDRFNRRYLSTYDQGLACDMTGGSSGGPWYAEFNTGPGTGIATSVNSFKYTNDPTTMYGPYFGNYAKAVYDRAVELDGSGAPVAVAAPSQLP